MNRAAKNNYRRVARKLLLLVLQDGLWIVGYLGFILGIVKLLDILGVF